MAAAEVAVAAAAAAAALNVCSQVKTCIRRLAQPSRVRGLARACRCHYVTVSISVGMQ